MTWIEGRVGGLRCSLEQLLGLGSGRVLIKRGDAESAALRKQFVTKRAESVTKRPKTSFLASRGAVDVRF